MSIYFIVCFFYLDSAALDSVEDWGLTLIRSSARNTGLVLQSVIVLKIKTTIIVSIFFWEAITLLSFLIFVTCLLFQGSMLVHFKRAAPSLDHLIRPYIRPSVRLYVQYYIWLAQCPSLPGALAHTLPLSLLCRGRSAYDKTLLVPSRHHLSQEPGRGWHSFINVKNNYLSLLSLRLIYYYSTF